MGRVFTKKITPELLKEKIKQEYIKVDGGQDCLLCINGYLMKELSSTISKDLSKINFDGENILGWSKSELNDHEELGLHTLSNGLTFYGFEIGGDWEFPVYVIIYFDGKELRGYIPTKGNVFDKKYKQAYGNSENIRNISEEERNRLIDIEEDIISSDGEFNFSELKKDIENRIKFKGDEKDEVLDLTPSMYVFRLFKMEELDIVYAKISLLSDYDNNKTFNDDYINLNFLPVDKWNQEMDSCFMYISSNSNLDEKMKESKIDLINLGLKEV